MAARLFILNSKSNLDVRQRTRAHTRILKLKWSHKIDSLNYNLQKKKYLSEFRSILHSIREHSSSIAMFSIKLHIYIFSGFYTPTYTHKLIEIFRKAKREGEFVYSAGLTKNLV